MDTVVHNVPALDLSSLSFSSNNQQSASLQQHGGETYTNTTIINSQSGYGLKYGTEDFKAKDLVRSDTPHTYLGEFPNKPDITIKCEKCGYFIDVVDLKEHRKYHSCLHLMKYKDGVLPETTEELFKRRNQLVKKVKQTTKENTPPDPKKIQQINEAYEYLKTHIEDTFEQYRQIQKDIDTTVHGVALNCSPDCAYAVGIASSPNQHWKHNMEDSRAYQDFFGEDRRKCYLGIFDGHNGHFAAETAAMELHGILLNEMRKFDPATKSTNAVNMAEDSDFVTDGDERPLTQESERATYHNESVKLVNQIIEMCEAKFREQTTMGENSEQKEKKKKACFKTVFSERMSEAFKKSYELFDILLSYGKDEHSKVRWSGCSALTMVLQDTGHQGSSDEDKEDANAPKEIGTIHLANAGNVHGLLIRGNHSYRLTKDHSTKNKKERERIVKAGCFVNTSSKDCRVNGILSTTRGLGNHGDLRLKRGVVVQPHTTCVSIDQYAQFLVMASNGVWEVFSDQEVASLLLKMLPSNQIRPPSHLSESVDNLLKEQENSMTEQEVKFQDGEEKTSTSSTRPVELMTIPADMKTEAGSHFGEDVDQYSRLHDDEMISVPVNCDIPDHKPESKSDHRRELAKSMAEFLVQATLLAGSRDNVTAMVTLLPGCGL